MEISIGSLKLLQRIKKESQYEGHDGSPEACLTGLDPIEKGHFTDLKKKDLISYYEYDFGTVFVQLTESGKEILKTKDLNLGGSWPTVKLK